MISNESRKVKLLTYSSAVDEYGQVRKGSYTSKDIEMYVKTFSQSNGDNPKYVDVELLGLTKESISTSNMIEIDSVKYSVLYVVNTKRYNEVFLRKTYQ